MFSFLVKTFARKGTCRQGKLMAIFFGRRAFCPKPAGGKKTTPVCDAKTFSQLLTFRFGSLQA
jgi:hypothetical protein